MSEVDQNAGADTPVDAVKVDKPKAKKPVVAEVPVELKPYKAPAQL